MPDHPAGRRQAKPISDGRKGINLGYAGSMKNILFWDPKTEKVRECLHVIFKEAMNDLPFNEKPPNAHLLDCLKTGKLDEIDIGEMPLPDLDVSTCPFVETKRVTVHVDYEHDFPLGLTFHTCTRLHHAYVHRAIRPPVGFHTTHSFKSQFIGAYIVSLNDSPIFDVQDIDAIVDRLASSATAPDTVVLELAPEQHSEEKTHESPLHLRMQDIHQVCALQSVAGEGMRGNAYTRAINERTTSLECSCFASVIHRLQADGMTEEERNIKGSFTRRKLMRLSNSDQWIECFDKQLDDHHAIPLFGKPVLRRSLAGTNGKPPHILRLHWNNIVKPSGVRKCRCCMDASK